MRLAAPLLMLALAAPVAAQTTAPPQNQQTSSSQTGTPRFVAPPITVTAQKEPEDKQKLPVSVTAVSRATLESAGIHLVGEAAIYAPSTYFIEWSARKLSVAQFRGISAGPNNPGITTYIDGVPQMSANSSSIELLDVDQIEFVRGPQSSLFGRNTLGGLVNIASSRPSFDKWTGTLTAPFGNHGAWTVRGTASGPIVDGTMSLGVSFAQVNRDGFAINDVTGNDIDKRSAFSGKAQLLWTPNSAWETRIIFTGERARDGDYSLHDVASLRANPFHVARDFEGHVDRDVLGTTIQARRFAPGGPIVFSSTTGFLDWKTQDVTDLDYTPQPILTRDNTENNFQFTQEFRVASAPPSAPAAVGDSTRLRWQAGTFFFTQAYQQDAINSYSPGLVGPIAVSQHTPRSDLDDFGIGVFGQGTVTFNGRLDLTAGARVDYENKSAKLEDFYDPAIFPGSEVDAEETFSNVSPQAAVSYRVRPDKMVYAAVGRGFKAGGFNAASPAGSEAYGEEHAWHFEGGAKTLWADGRLTTNAALFYIDWKDLQLFRSNPAVPTQFYLSNVGGAVSKGVELEINAHAAPGLEVFSSVGYTHARFGTGSISGRLNVEGNKIPSTPEYTTSAGLQYSRAVGQAATLRARAEVIFYGSFQYNDANTLAQEAYSLVNLRFGATGRLLTGEVFVRNAFDTKYIPFAFPYQDFAPSGYVGELGAPRSVGVSAGVRF